MKIGWQYTKLAYCTNIQAYFFWPTLYSYNNYVYYGFTEQINKLDYYCRWCWWSGFIGYYVA